MPTPDQVFVISIPNNGGIVLKDSLGNTVDQVGFSIGSAFKEGTPLPPLVGNIDQSYERVLGGCQDLNNNSFDFSLINPSNFRNLASPLTPCAVPCPTTTTICFQSLNINFEPPFYFGSGSGNPLDGTEGWTDSSGNWGIFPYVGNTLGVNLNLTGGDQFIAAQVGSASSANHNLNISSFGAVRIKFDINFQFFNSVSSPGQEIGSFSFIPFGVNQRDFKIALQWQDSLATQLAMVLQYYNSSGVLQPVTIPSPAWDNLVLNRWYRINMLLSFISGRIDLVNITDLVTSISTTDVNFFSPGWYLGGGTSPVGFPTEISLVSGGPISDSTIIAFDNVSVECNPYIVGTPQTLAGTDQPYTYQPNVFDGLPPYQWQFNCLTIPSGMTIDPSTGLITWPSPVPGSYFLSIDVTDSLGNSSPGLTVPDLHEWILNVTSTLTINSTPPTTGSAGIPYSYVPTVINHIPPDSWSFTGPVPPGMGINFSTGEVSWPFPLTGAYFIEIQVYDSVFNNDIQNWTLTII